MIVMTYTIMLYVYYQYIYIVDFQVYHDSTIDIWEFGTTVMTACIVVMLLHAAIETRSWVSKKK